MGEVLQAIYRVENHDRLGKPWIECWNESTLPTSLPGRVIGLPARGARQWLAKVTLNPVVAMETPDATTFVLKVDKPQPVFLEELSAFVVADDHQHLGAAALLDQVSVELQQLLPEIVLTTTSTEAAAQTFNKQMITTPGQESEVVAQALFGACVEAANEAYDATIEGWSRALDLRAPLEPAPATSAVPSEEPSPDHPDEDQP